MTGAERVVSAAPVRAQHIRPESTTLRLAVLVALAAAVVLALACSLGMSLPISTPPNAIALGALAERGHHISFASWMVMAVPLMLVILLGAWLLLIALFIPAGLGIELDMRATWHTDRRAATLYPLARCGLAALRNSEAAEGFKGRAVFLLHYQHIAFRQAVGNNAVQLHVCPSLAAWIVGKAFRHQRHFGVFRRRLGVIQAEGVGITLGFQLAQ